jgi:hypothetical protein
VQKQVLSDRLDRLEHMPVDALGDTLGLRPRMRRLRGNSLPDQHLQTARRPMNCVALGHLAIRTSALAP